MTESLKIEGGGQSINLYPWLKPQNGLSGVEALAGIEGFGMPEGTPRWFTGAGIGSSWRGTRINKRRVKLPLHVYADNRAELNEKISMLARCLDPSAGEQARIFFGMPDGDEWWIDVVRDSGGDWKRKVDSDDRTFFQTTFELDAGDPFWTRGRAESFPVRPDDSGRGLLPNLAEMELSSGASFGVKEVVNVGDAPAWPTWEVKGPATKLTLIGAGGETLIWEGDIDEGESLHIDARNSIIEDGTGANRYSELGTSPKFWFIRPGTSHVTVQIDGSALGVTEVICKWAPRRWAVV